MRHLALAFVILLATVAPLGARPAPVQAADCRFVLGFLALQQLIPDQVGNCLANATFNGVTGDATQPTTGPTGAGGLMVWRKFDNFTAFTDGFRTWVNGPFGLQMRLNSQRFFWEANPETLPVVPLPPQGDRCHTGGLSLALQNVDHGTGDFVATFVLTNNLAVSCTLSGFAGLQLLNAHNDPLPTNVVPQGGNLATLPGPSPVTLLPGGAASFKVHWETVPATGEQCSTSSLIKVIPPGEFDGLALPFSITACGGGRLDESAIAVSAQVSNNWSGYTATGGTFTAVSGTWIVPTSRSVGVPSSSAAWVGIGGLISRDLIQAGTEGVNDGVTAQYDAWIELLPQPPTIVPLGVKPGDSVTVAIAQQPTGLWSISLTNNTTGRSFQTAVSYASSLSSAEWIQEAPSTRRRIVPLDAFGTVEFSGASTVKDGQRLNLAQAGATPITMIDRGGNQIAVPGGLTPDGSGFSVARTGP